MIPYKEVSKEVLYSAERVVRIDRRDIDELVARADRNPRKRIRICSHPGADDRLHEMLIVHARDTYVPPHKHPGKSESFHVIDGRVDIVLFDDAGGIREIIRMGDYRSGLKFYYRLSDPVYHTLLIYSEHLVFHETTNGPFSRADTVFANWAPDPAEEPASKTYMEWLAGEAKKLGG